MSWIDRPSAALQTDAVTDIAGTNLSLHVQWLSTITPSELEQVRDMMMHAYTTPTMWEYYREYLDGDANLLLFTLRLKSTGEIVGTRSIGEAAWGSEYWDEHARLIGQDIPIAGMGFTVKKNYRAQGWGEILWRETSAWIKRHSDIQAVFGDTHSRRALEMYLKKGAWFFTADLEKLLELYQVQDIYALLDATVALEKIECDCALRYAWPLCSESGERLTALGYKPGNGAA